MASKLPNLKTGCVQLHVKLAAYTLVTQSQLSPREFQGYSSQIRFTNKSYFLREVAQDIKWKKLNQRQSPQLHNTIKRKFQLTTNESMYTMMTLDFGNAGHT